MTEKHAGGRPTDFSQEIADAVFTHMVEGKSVRSFCANKANPSLTTLYRWLRENPEFRQQYESGLEMRADTHAEQLIEISEDDTGDVQRDRLKVDTRKWLMSRMKPKKYGDKITQEHTGKDGAPLNIEIVRFGEREDNATE